MSGKASDYIDPKDLLKLLRPGDLIEFNCKWFIHWAIYIAAGWVIQVSAGAQIKLASSGSGEKAKRGVCCIKLENAAKGYTKIRKNNRLDDKHTPFKPIEIVARAILYWDILSEKGLDLSLSWDQLSENGHKLASSCASLPGMKYVYAYLYRYHLLKNNCEHFANMIRYGVPVCNQLRYTEEYQKRSSPLWEVEERLPSGIPVSNIFAGIYNKQEDARGFMAAVIEEFSTGKFITFESNITRNVTCWKRDPKELLPHLRPGDRIQFKGKLHHHWAIYIIAGWVIQLTAQSQVMPPSSGNNKKHRKGLCCVKLENAAEGYIEIRKNNNLDDMHAPFEPIQIVARAIMYLDLLSGNGLSLTSDAVKLPEVNFEDSYPNNSFGTMCKCFANMIPYGVPVCYRNRSHKELQKRSSPLWEVEERLPSRRLISSLFLEIYLKQKKEIACSFMGSVIKEFPTSHLMFFESIITRNVTCWKRDPKDLLPLLRPGDRMQFKGKLHHHWAIYIIAGWVIQLTAQSQVMPPSSGNNKKHRKGLCCVKLENAAEGYIEIRKNNNLDDMHAPFEPIQIVARAIMYLDLLSGNRLSLASDAVKLPEVNFEDSYPNNSFGTMCKCFANMIRYGVPVCYRNRSHKELQKRSSPLWEVEERFPSKRLISDIFAEIYQKQEQEDARGFMAAVIEEFPTDKSMYFMPHNVSDWKKDPNDSSPLLSHEDHN